LKAILSTKSSEKVHDTTLQILVKATAKFGKKTSATTLTETIATGALSIEKADSITYQPKDYLTKLIAIRNAKKTTS
jgi:hypothetical protein